MSTDIEVVVDFEFLKGCIHEIVKEISVAAIDVSDSFRFKSPYTIVPTAPK